MAAVTDWVRSMVGLGEQIKTAAGSILPRTSQDKTPPALQYYLDREYIRHGSRKKYFFFALRL